MKTAKCLGLVMLLLSAHVKSELPDIFDQLSGEWTSDDDSFLGPSRSYMRWSPDYLGVVYKIEYRIEPKSVEEQAFTARAYYKPVTYCESKAFWVDSLGDMVSIDAICEETGLLANWDDKRGNRGKSRYALESENTLRVTDWILVEGSWQQFSDMRFNREPDASARLVTGIGGIFFRGNNPKLLSSWYESAFEITSPPESYEQLPWKQDSGYTVFSPFPEDTDFFGSLEQQWMLNLRVSDLDKLISKLRKMDIEVSDPELFPNGRFSRLKDPEGNPIQLWEP